MFRTAVIAAKIKNPLDGIIPDFTIFGAQFNQLWEKLVAGLWGIAIVVSVVFIISGVVRMAAASGPNANPAAHAEGRKAFLLALLSFAILCALAVIIGAIITVVG